jgi:hypothetical protein
MPVIRVMTKRPDARQSRKLNASRQQARAAAGHLERAWPGAGREGWSPSNRRSGQPREPLRAGARHCAEGVQRHHRADQLGQHVRARKCCRSSLFSCSALARVWATSSAGRASAMVSSLYPPIASQPSRGRGTPPAGLCCPRSARHAPQRPVQPVPCHLTPALPPCSPGISVPMSGNGGTLYMRTASVSFAARDG